MDFWFSASFALEQDEADRRTMPSHSLADVDITFPFKDDPAGARPRGQRWMRRIANRDIGQKIACSVLFCRRRVVASFVMKMKLGTAGKFPEEVCGG